MLQYATILSEICESRLLTQGSMQYHQIVIFTHRPWVSKHYIQPRSPRQGPGYHHARRMCIESSMAVARLLQIYEKHYTFRRMNNQVVAIIFSAALMLLYVTISPGKANNNENGAARAEMVAYLNLCFRALDELGQSFENAKRTRDFLVSLQRRWQAHMRRSGAKRQMGNRQSSQPPAQGRSEADPSRKRSRLSVSGHSFPTATATAANNSNNNRTNKNKAFAIPATPPSTQPQPQSQPQAIPPPLNQAHLSGDIDWIHNSDLQLLSEGLANDQFPQIPGNPASYAEASTIPSLADIEPWWESPNGTTTFGGSSL